MLHLFMHAAFQVPNSDVSMCMICTSEFSVVRRRHHCRACGKVVCGPCSEDRVPLPYLGNSYGRVCPACFKVWERETAGKSEFWLGVEMAARGARGVDTLDNNNV